MSQLTELQKRIDSGKIPVIVMRNAEGVVVRLFERTQPGGCAYEAVVAVLAEELTIRWSELGCMFAFRESSAKEVRW